VSTARQAMIALLLLLATSCGVTPVEEDDEASAPAADTSAIAEELLVVLTPAQEQAASLTIGPAVPATSFRLLRVTGEVAFHPNHIARVSPRLVGRVDSVLADLGTRVRTGQVLALVDSPERTALEARYMAGLANHEAAKSSMERAQRLRENEAISLRELQERVALEASARVELESAENQLRLLGIDEDQLLRLRATPSADDGGNVVHAVFPIRSPIAGTIIERDISTGEIVSPDSPTFTVSDTSRLQIFFNVYARDLAGVRPGLETTFVTETYPDRAFQGKVDFVSPRVDEVDRAAKVRAVVPNSDGLLRPGMFVTGAVSVPLDSGATDIGVPPSAIVQLDGRSHVFAQEKPGTFRALPVEVSERDADLVRVRSGLTAGQSIVLGGAFTLKAHLKRGTFEDED